MYNICMTMSFHIVGLGLATLDYIAGLDHFPKPDEKCRTKNFCISGGGNCANTLAALSRLKCSTTLLSCIGDDSFGQQILDSLDQEHINTDHILRKSTQSPFSYIISDYTNHTRTSLDTRESDEDLLIPIPDDVLDDCDFVFLDGSFTKSAIALAQRATAQNIPIMLELENPRYTSVTLLNQATIVVASKDYILQNHKNSLDPIKSGMQELLDAGPQLVIATMGEDGAIAMGDSHIQQVPAYPVKSIDTTGAGDAFNAGFIFGCLNRWSVNSTLRFASLIAGRCCKHPGARTGLPHLAELESFIAGLSQFDTY